jgi:formylglycine-generating enzyme required for sulfatase activity
MHSTEAQVRVLQFIAMTSAALTGSASAIGAEKPAALVAGNAPLTAAQERALKPKDAFRECADCPEMRVVPAGSYAMGSPPGDDHHDDEGPLHAVTVSRAFATGKFHVTVDQFAAFLRATGYQAGTNCHKWGQYEDRRLLARSRLRAGGIASRCVHKLG